MLSPGAPARDLGYQPALDGVRALAIIGVLLLHLSLWGAVPRVTPGGHLGVAVFFVLSGYLITRLLMDEHVRSGRVDMSAFYARRAARLLPALLLLLVVHTLVWGTQRPSWTIALQIAVGLCYLTSLVHPVIFDVGGLSWTWSLSVEEHFYLFWPAVLRRALAEPRGRTIAMWCCGGMIAVAVTLRALLNDSATWHDFVYYSTPARMDALAVGCLAALATHGRRLTVPVPLAWAAFGLLVVSYFVPALGQGTRVMNLLGLPLLSVATVVLILGLVGRPDRGPARLLSARPLVHIGKISYGLYLWNLLAGQSMRMVFGESRTGWLGTVLGLALTLVAVELSYWCLERPVLRWTRHRLAARRQPAHRVVIPRQPGVERRTPQPAVTPATIGAGQYEPTPVGGRR
ncbi:acyltransferase family protein [Micromonospora sp. NPDC048930]|uniref:acyltransferase family protein n=1 Tax=Micromonospora sp. NPDC048930 TaxID=3364261 RepID=UPI00371D904A